MLEHAMLQNNTIIDTTALRSCRNLRTLRVDGNSLSSFNGSGLNKLTLLNLSHNQISSTDGLQHLKQLHTLKATHNQLTSLGGLVSLLSLEEMHLSGNPLGNGGAGLKGLQAFKLLQSLHLDECNLNNTMLRSLKQPLPSVQEVSLAGNALTQLAHVAHAFPNLRVLDVSGNALPVLNEQGCSPLGDLVPLSALVDLSVAENALCLGGAHSVTGAAARAAGGGAAAPTKAEEGIQLLPTVGSWDHAVATLLPSLWVLDGVELRCLVTADASAGDEPPTPEWEAKQEDMLAAGLPTLPSSRLHATARVLLHGAGAVARNSAAGGVSEAVLGAADAAASAAALSAMRHSGASATNAPHRRSVATSVKERTASLLGTGVAEGMRGDFALQLKRRNGQLQVEQAKARGTLSSASALLPAAHAVGASLPPMDPMGAALSSDEGLDALFARIQRKHTPAWARDSDEDDSSSGSEGKKDTENE
jgi:hypothetical protein